MTYALAWSMALLLLSAGVAGIIIAVIEFISAYRGFSYMGNGYWWKKAISWKKAAVSLTVILCLLVFGVMSIVHLVSVGGIQ